jgi:hypothetical protein
VHSENALFPIDINVVGNTILDSVVLLLNTPEAMLVTPSGIVTEDIGVPVYPVRTLFSMVRLKGMGYRYGAYGALINSIGRPVRENALSPIIVTLAGSIMFVSALQESNIVDGIVVTPGSTTTLVNAVQL